jgi:hypothetical protein
MDWVNSMIVLEEWMEGTQCMAANEDPTVTVFIIPEQ